MSKSKSKRKRAGILDAAEFRALTIVKLAEEVARLNGGEVRADGVPTDDVIRAIDEAEDLATEEMRATLESEALGASYGLLLKESREDMEAKLCR